MKKMALIGLMALSGCAELTAPQLFGGDVVAKQVNVMGRTWTVWQDAKDSTKARAQRDNNNLNPYGPPAIPRVVQASRAIQAATGCTPIRSSMYSNDMGQFYARLSCPAGTAPQG